MKKNNSTRRNFLTGLAGISALGILNPKSLQAETKLYQPTPPSQKDWKKTKREVGDVVIRIPFLYYEGGLITSIQSVKILSVSKSKSIFKKKDQETGEIKEIVSEWETYSVEHLNDTYQSSSIT